MELIKFDDVIIGTIIKRPSLQIKSPYVADVLVKESKFLAHCPSLGLGGLIQPEVKVLMTVSTTKSKTDYVIQAVYSDNIWIGNVPLHANRIVKQLLGTNLIIEDILSVKPEVTHGDSRYDFQVQTERGEMFCEVKSVHINENEHKSTAIFPVGYKKPKQKTVSERANKHVTGLTEIAKKGCLAMIIFVVQRNDCTSFQPNRTGDPVFSELLDDAISSGVKVCVVYTTVNESGIYLNNIKC
jgi:sugar fermentation stimulation protein A